MPNLLVTATTRYDPKGLNKAKKDIKGFDKQIKALGKTFLGLFAAQKVLAFGKASVKAFAADDKAARLLTNTLENLGAGYAATNVEDFIAKLQNATGVLDDALRPALQTLLTATGDVQKSQGALALALDISANGVISLETATKALAKGFQGNTTSLGKMGGAVSKATLATGDMNKITAELTAKYKGSALTAAAGYSGQIDKLTVASENAKEIIGKGLLNSLTLLGGEGGIGSVTKAIEALSIGLSEAIVSTSKLIKELQKMPVVGSYLERIISNPLNLPSGALAFGKGGMVDKYREIGRSPIKTGYGQQSPGDRNKAIAANAKLLAQRKLETDALTAKNKATKEELQLKKDQAALDELKKKFDLERIGILAALAKATDDETKARLQAMLAILDENAAGVKTASENLAKVMADKAIAEALAIANLGKFTLALDGTILKSTVLNGDLALVSSGLRGYAAALSTTGPFQGATGFTPFPTTNGGGSTSTGGGPFQGAPGFTSSAMDAANALLAQQLADAIKALKDAATATTNSKPTIKVIVDPTVIATVVQDAVIENGRAGNNLYYGGSLARANE
jgi:tetratricopeptide (TPR) repeat protein